MRLLTPILLCLFPIYISATDIDIDKQREPEAGIEERITGGLSNDIWHVISDSKNYILRKPKNRVEPLQFAKILEISKKAFTYGIGPEVLGEDAESQQILLAYIDHSPWPTYEENPSPYHKTMHLLRHFHDNISLDSSKIEQTYEPFQFIFNTDTTLLPSHFLLAIEKIKLIFEALHSWLNNHAILCHGDFTKNNVLLSLSGQPVIIDFDSAAIGDPFFDIVKFSLTLPKEQRLELLEAYLGKRKRTSQEEAHFELMDMVLLMVVTTARFQIAAQIYGDRLAIDAMEEILNSTDSFPSFLDISATSAKSWQLSALYALKEFLQRSRDPNFNKILTQFN